MLAGLIFLVHYAVFSVFMSANLCYSFSVRREMMYEGRGFYGVSGNARKRGRV
jgi:hypothetical protein